MASVQPGPDRHAIDDDIDRRRRPEEVDHSGNAPAFRRKIIDAVDPAARERSSGSARKMTRDFEAIWASGGTWRTASHYATAGGRGYPGAVRRQPRWVGDPAGGYPGLTDKSTSAVERIIDNPGQPLHAFPGRKQHDDTPAPPRPRPTLTSSDPILPRPARAPVRRHGPGPWP